MHSDAHFRARYRALEQRMRSLAEADGDVFLPGSPPDGPAQFVLVCMEPSLGWWARSADEARERVAAGFRNFFFSIEDFILHLCARRFLCEPGQRYHLTDLSKGAMLVSRAGAERGQRYDRWYALLQEEVDLVATPTAGVIAVGDMVASHLERRGFERPVTRVIHYSCQAGSARKQGIVGREGEFATFKGSVSLQDVIDTASDVMTSAGVPGELRGATLTRLARSELTTSRQQLLFIYKTAFESMRAWGQLAV